MTGDATNLFIDHNRIIMEALETCIQDFVETIATSQLEGEVPLLSNGFYKLCEVIINQQICYYREKTFP